MRIHFNPDHDHREFCRHRIFTPPPPVASTTMPLHLLHHKSWHVYNSANIERVQRDKENARRKEEEEEQRQNKADQQRRLAQLRGNAYDTTDLESAPVDPSVYVERPSNHIPGVKRGKPKHVNLFEDIESAKKVETNPEREKELAIEKKKWEDLVTSKLINATNEHAPWYSQLDGVSGAEKNKSDVERELRAQKQEKWKSDADPLKTMEKFLARKREVDEEEDRRRRKMETELTERERRRGRARTPEMADESRRRRRHRDETERHHREEAEGRRKRHRSKSRSPRREHRSRHHRHHRHKSPSPAPANLDHLRAEKEKREVAEREKVARITGRQRDDKRQERYQPVGHAGYSAQFHPEAVRR